MGAVSFRLRRTSMLEPKYVVLIVNYGRAVGAITGVRPAAVFYTAQEMGDWVSAFNEEKDRILGERRNQIAAFTYNVGYAHSDARNEARLAANL